MITIELCFVISLITEKKKKDLYHKVYREANKEKIKDANKNHYDNNKEQKREYNKIYREANKEKIKESQKDYRYNNKEQTKSYREANKEQLTEYHKEYCKANPEKFSNYSRKRRARKMEAEGSVHFLLHLDLLKEQDNKCVYCGKDLSEGYHMDHIVPLSKGGTNWPDNLQILCPTCNLVKNGKLPQAYEKSIGYERDPEFFNNFRLYNTDECFKLTEEDIERKHRELCERLKEPLAPERNTDV